MTQKAKRHRRIRKRASRAANTRESANELLSFTMDVGTGEVVTCEALGANGARHKLSESEKTALAKGAHLGLEEVVGRAFEAGLSCALDESAEDLQDTAAESEEDAELRRLLLTSLMERSPARQLLRREVLSRVILETLIERSMNSRSATAGKTPGAGAMSS
jgi:hypothetical protein